MIKIYETKHIFSAIYDTFIICFVLIMLIIPLPIAVGQVIQGNKIVLSCFAIPVFLFVIILMAHQLLKRYLYYNKCVIDKEPVLTIDEEGITFIDFHDIKKKSFKWEEIEDLKLKSTRSDFFIQIIPKDKTLRKKSHSHFVLRLTIRIDHLDINGIKLLHYLRGLQNGLYTLDMYYTFKNK